MQEQNVNLKQFSALEGQPGYKSALHHNVMHCE